MAWRRPGDKPLSEPMMISWLTHICVTRPQWVKTSETTVVIFLYKSLFRISTKKTSMLHITDPWSGEYTSDCRIPSQRANKWKSFHDITMLMECLTHTTLSEQPQIYSNSFYKTQIIFLNEYVYLHPSYCIYDYACVSVIAWSVWTFCMCWTANWHG